MCMEMCVYVYIYIYINICIYLYIVVYRYRIYIWILPSFATVNCGNKNTVGFVLRTA